MKYILNPSAMQSLIMVPSEAVKSHIKLASTEQLRVLILTMSDISSGVNPEKTAEELGIHIENVLDALNFWCEAGIFSEDGKIDAPQKSAKPKTARIETAMPTREEIAKIGETDEKLVFLLRDAEQKFKRPLRFSEIQSLAYLYLDEGMKVSVILMLVEFAISKQKPKISFINKTAREWLDAGVSTVADVEEQIKADSRKSTAWNIVKTTFGIEDRKPSDSELTYSARWVDEWGFSREMLKLAYDKCIDLKARLIMSYINTILENWHKKGIKAPQDITSDQQKPKPIAGTGNSSSGSSYDKELFNKMINSDDDEEDEE